MKEIFYSEEPFILFSWEHLISFLVFSGAGIFFIVYSKGKSFTFQLKVLRGMAILLSFMIISWVFIEIALERFYIESDLPFVFCNFVALFLPVYAFKREKYIFDIIYYVIIVGAIQAIITPALKFSFPHYEYWKFWTVHVGLIIFILYEIIIFKRRPTIKGIFITFLFVQVYLLMIILVNVILDSNYLFLNEKPPVRTFLDLLGEWPYYVIIMDIILIPYFFITFLPFYFLKSKNS